MKPKKMAIFLITILFVCIILLIAIVFYMIKLNNNTDNEEENNVINNQNTDDKNSVEMNNNVDDFEDEEISNYNETGDWNISDEEYANYTDEEKEDLKRSGIYVTDYIETEDGIQIVYSDDEINNFDFKINGIPDEVLEYVDNIDDVYFKIKEYVYQRPEIVATEANYETYKLYNGEKALMIYFYLNDDFSNLLVVINLENQSEISIEKRYREEEERR